MAYKVLRTGDSALDRIQANVQAAFKELSNDQSATVQAVTASVTPDNAVDFLAVDPRGSALVVTLPATRTNPITVINTGKSGTVMLQATIANGDKSIPNGWASALLPINGVYWVFSRYGV